MRTKRPLAQTISMGALLPILFCQGGCAMTHAPKWGPSENWDFRFKDFVIGAWWGPCPSDAEMKVYKEAGFNTVMAGRYMAMADYGNVEKLERDLEAARKHGLGAFIDMYTTDERPWGGIPGDPHAKARLPEWWREMGGTGAFQMSANFEQFKWLYENFGRHPATIGFLLADDQAVLTPPLVQMTDFLLAHEPHLMPWICQNNFLPKELAKRNNPISSFQTYPTLYQRHKTAPDQMQVQCDSFNIIATACEKHNIAMWPMFDVCGDRSDSLVRFQVYASAAYGADGIWYFCYKTGLTKATRCREGYTIESMEEMRAELLPEYDAAKEANNRILRWGDRLLGCVREGIVNTGYEVKDGKKPGAGTRVAEMDDDLLVGLLTKPGRCLMAMVVDKRVSKKFGELAPREVRVVFDDSVRKIAPLEGANAVSARAKGNVLEMTLPAGGGQLVELRTRE
ncbi:MAG TPA: hypothetical protein VM492_03350 [Sumerlaeia bacterium]|nr:hypothetical protein [Sumerlaeia bacterium]